MFKDTLDGATNFCRACEDIAQLIPDRTVHTCGKDDVCSALIHTRGFGDMPGPIYCAEKKPCKWHNKNQVSCSECQFEDGYHSRGCSHFKEKGWEPQKKCICACHSSPYGEPYEHDTSCCAKINGKVVEPQKGFKWVECHCGTGVGCPKYPKGLPKEDPQKRSWSDEFDDKFVKKADIAQFKDVSYVAGTPYDIKAFISHTIEEKRAKDRTALAKKIDTLLRNNSDYNKGVLDAKNIVNK